jgi:hypothetical protein
MDVNKAGGIIIIATHILLMVSQMPSIVDTKLDGIKDSAKLPRIIALITRESPRIG